MGGYIFPALCEAVKVLCGSPVVALDKTVFRDIDDIRRSVRLRFDVRIHIKTPEWFCWVRYYDDTDVSIFKKNKLFFILLDKPVSRYVTEDLT